MLKENSNNKVYKENEYEEKDEKSVYLTPNQSVPYSHAYAFNIAAFVHCQIDAFACSFFSVYRFSFNTCPLLPLPLLMVFFLSLSSCKTLF